MAIATVVAARRLSIPAGPCLGADGERPRCGTRAPAAAVGVALIALMAWAPGASAGTVVNGVFVAAEGEANVLTVSLDSDGVTFADDVLDLATTLDTSSSVPEASSDASPDGRTDIARCGTSHDTLVFPDRDDRRRACEATSVSENRSVDHLVRRASRISVRVHIREIFSAGGGEDLHIVLTPRVSPRPQLTRP